MSQPTTTCLGCKHWLPRETPPWAARLGMGICAQKLTKSVTLNNWARCESFAPVTAEQVARRSVWLVARGVRVAAVGVTA